MHPITFLKKRVATIALVSWFAAMLIIGAGLLARHLVALPAPDGDRLGASLAMRRTDTEKHQWLAIHVLYSDCRCSLRVAEHLAESVRPEGFSEMILWIGKEAPSPELERRFDIRRVTEAEAALTGVEAAPSLFVLDPEDHVRYSGGYTDRKQGPSIEDVRIMRAARNAEAVASLPIFGCAVSDKLKGELSALPTP